MHEYRALIVPVLYTIALTFLCLLPLDTNDIQSQVPFVDKLFHGISYTLLVIVWGVSLSSYKKISFSHIALAAFVYGIIIELLQASLITRTADIYDVLFNGVGILIGLIIVTFLYQKARKNNK